MIPLLVGAAELGYFAYIHNIGAASHTNTNTEAVAYLTGVLLVMAGLVIAGPWLTMLGSRLMARRANRPGTLIAARRLADNPKAGFRAISGLVLALFVGTCAIGIITTLSAYDGGSAGASASADSTGTLVGQFPLHLGPTGLTSGITTIPTATMNKLTSTAGVTGVAVIRDRYIPTPALRSGTRFDPIESVVSCAELAGTPALGHCPPDADTVTIVPHYGFIKQGRSSMAETTWHASAVAATQLQRLPIDSIVVGTNGSVAAVERARTVLDLTSATPYAPQTISEIQANSSKLLDGYRQLANVVILTSLPIAGCALAVSIAGGLAERKRPFSLLRLTGTPLAMLRRVVTLEAAAPLLLTAIISIGAGLLSAQLFLRAQLQETLQPPGLEYYLIVVAGLVAALAIIASTLPLLNRITGPEVARNE